MFFFKRKRKQHDVFIEYYDNNEMCVKIQKITAVPRLSGKIFLCNGKIIDHTFFDDMNIKTILRHFWYKNFLDK